MEISSNFQAPDLTYVTSAFSFKLSCFFPDFKKMVFQVVYNRSSTEHTYICQSIQPWFFAYCRHTA